MTTSCLRFVVLVTDFGTGAVCFLLFNFASAVVFAFLLGPAAMIWVGCLDGSLPGGGGGLGPIARFLGFAGRRVMI